jgi:hypothetical protein
MVAAFIPWLVIRLVIEFVFRAHFMTTLTTTANFTHGCGEGIGFAPQATGRIGDRNQTMVPGRTLRMNVASHR